MSTASKKAFEMFTAPMAAAVESLDGHKRKAFKNAFEKAKEHGEGFVKAVIALKKITLSDKHLTWSLVAEDLGYTADSLDARIYRHEHPNAPRTRINTDSPVVETTTLSGFLHKDDRPELLEKIANLGPGANGDSVAAESLRAYRADNPQPKDDTLTAAEWELVQESRAKGATVKEKKGPRPKMPDAIVYGKLITGIYGYLNQFKGEQLRERFEKLVDELRQELGIKDGK